MLSEPVFTIGIEEEYLLVDRASRDLIREAPPGILAECEKQLETQVTPEFLQCQIEVGTRVCDTVQKARSDLARLRKTVAAVASDHGLAIIAASTHPFSHRLGHKHTDKLRYHMLARDMQAIARNMLICGMHVHVGIEDEDLRIDLMGQASYLLPHLLALSTSSPFWEGDNTGLKSYRLAVWDQMPRSGMPEQFDSWSEFQRHVGVLVQTGVIEDSTKIWWDIRPSARFPTLEMRMSDICTRLDDGICIAALYRCWLRMLYRLRLANQRWRRYTNLMLDENRWRAQRYGYDNGLIDFGKSAIVPYTELLDELLLLIREDAEHFNCVAEVEHARAIIQRGTSAHWQLATYERARSEGASESEALRAVVDMLIEETVHGL
jgi:carboxylate-amine ligase